MIIRHAVMSVLAAFILAPALAVGPAAVPLTPQDKEIWSDVLKKTVMQPPCCGACPIFTMADAKELRSFVIGQGGTPKAEKLWEIHHVKLLKNFRTLSPERFEALYSAYKEELEKTDKPNKPKGD